METFKYKYCVIKNNTDTVYLSNDKISISPLYDTILEDVKVNICDNGALDICGDGVEYCFTFEREKLSDINVTDTPHEDYIKHYKGLKIFGCYIKKPYDYVEKGWYRLRDKTPNRRIIMSKYKLKIK